MPRLHRRFAAAVFCLCAFPALAAPGFGALLKGTNFAAFSENDTRLFLAMAETTVRSQPDGVTVRFNSPQSGATATMKVARSYTKDSYSCRDLSGETVAKKNTEPFTLSYCRDKAGQWRLASSSSP